MTRVAVVLFVIMPVTIVRLCLHAHSERGSVGELGRGRGGREMDATRDPKRSRGGSGGYLLMVSSGANRSYRVGDNGSLKQIAAGGSVGPGGDGAVRERVPLNSLEELWRMSLEIYTLPILAIIG